MRGIKFLIGGWWWWGGGVRSHHSRRPPSGAFGGEYKLMAADASYTDEVFFSGTNFEWERLRAFFFFVMALDNALKKKEAVQASAQTPWELKVRWFRRGMFFFFESFRFMRVVERNPPSFFSFID